jgi:4-amino-4-deoxy-L-arabinose transferase-like glycosyltransferase
MDARLAMEGLRPMVDFNARQPLYVYAYVPFLWAGGADYVAGRMMPLAATLLGAAVLFLLGRRLAGASAGMAAALWYLFAPTVLINAPVVKTEPLAILLSALGMYAVVAHLDRGRWLGLALAGAVLGAGYYVRESTLGVTLAAVVLLAADLCRAGWARTAGRMAMLGAGYAAVCAATIAYYSRYLPVSRMVADASFSPVARLVNSARRLAARWHVTAAAPAERPAHLADQAALTDYSQAGETILRNVQQVLTLNAPLVAAAALALILGLMAWRRRDRMTEGERTGLLMAVSWTACLGLAYMGHAATKSFYQFYFREFIPPMALAMAVVLPRLARTPGAGADALRLTLIGLATAGAIFAAQRVWRGGGVAAGLLLGGAAVWPLLAGAAQSRTRAVVLAGAAAAIAALLLVNPGPGGRLVPAVWGAAGCGALAVAMAAIVARARVDASAAGRAAGLAILAGATAAGATLAARVLSPSYDCIWSPATIRSVTETVARHSAPGDEVLSGAVMWEFQAGREPFMRISHPLQFMEYLRPEHARSISARLTERPPRIIVMDGYTERTYARHLPQFGALLAERYRPAGEPVAGSRYPVQVYVLREQAT